MVVMSFCYTVHNERLFERHILRPARVVQPIDEGEMYYPRINVDLVTAPAPRRREPAISAGSRHGRVQSIRGCGRVDMDDEGGAAVGREHHGRVSWRHNWTPFAYYR